MTSAAFLFAIYLIKPAPFCVLDEVDAPLDDANVGKFTKMIRQFSDNSQFISISQESIGYPLFKDENTLLPTYSPTLPTQQNYQTGEMRRYFCKKTNELLYLEISKDTYDKLIKNDSTIAFQYYQPFNIPWQLTGNKEQVFTTNKNITALTMKQQKLSQFDKYLKEDYTKYYK